MNQTPMLRAVLWMLAMALVPAAGVHAQVEALTVADSHSIPARVMLLQPDVLIVADNNIVSVLDISALPDLNEISAVDIVDDVQGLARHGEYIYAAVGEQGVAVIRFDLFGGIEHLGTVAELGFAQRLAVSTSGNSLYAASGQVGILIADISDPSSPTLVGSPHLFFSPPYQFNGQTWQARLSVDDLAVFNGVITAVGQEITVPTDSGPMTFDFGVRTLARSFDDFFTLSSKPTATADTRLAISADRLLSGGRLAVGGSFEEGGFYTADLSNPNDPPAAPLLNDDGLLKVHDLRQGYAWTSHNTADTTFTLRGWDVSNPDAPVLRAQYRNNLPIEDAVVFGPHVLVGDADAIHVLNRPAFPAPIPLLRVYEPLPSMFVQREPGQTVTVGWQARLASVGDTVRILLVKSGLEVAELGLDQSPNGEGLGEFTVPPVPTGSDYRIRVRSVATPGVFADSSAVISITNGTSETAVDPEIWSRYR